MNDHSNGTRSPSVSGVVSYRSGGKLQLEDHANGPHQDHGGSVDNGGEFDTVMPGERTIEQIQELILGGSVATWQLLKQFQKTNPAWSKNISGIPSSLQSSFR